MPSVSIDGDDEQKLCFSVESSLHQVDINGGPFIICRRHARALIKI